MYAVLHLPAMNYPLQIETFSYKEVAIELFKPEQNFVKKNYEEQPGMFPFWCKIWPAAYAMAEFIIDNTDFVRNKKVLEIAAGLALPSLVAAKYAAAVCISDYAKDAVHIAEQSANTNGFSNTTAVVMDWNNIPAKLVADVVLMSDVNYEPEGFNKLYNIFKTLLEKNITILLTTPQRLMAKPFIEMISAFITYTEVRDVNINNTITAVSIYVLKAA